MPLTSPATATLDDLPQPIPSVRPHSKKKAAGPSHRVACLYHCCLLLAATLALCVALMGAVHLLRQMRARPRYVRGVCSLPIPVNQILDESMISGDFSEGAEDGWVNSLKPVRTPELVGERVSLTEKVSADGEVELDYELDLDYEEFEEFQMPQISHGRYLHDFKMNQTAIIDPDGNRCFVMPLDQDEVPKPKSFLQIIKNLKHGVYGLDIAEVRVDTRVVLPPIEDPEYFG